MQARMAGHDIHEGSGYAMRLVLYSAVGYHAAPFLDGFFLKIYRTTLPQSTSLLSSDNTRQR